MMVEKAFYLTEADLKTIKEYLKVSDDRRGNSPSKYQPQEGYLTPEVYMANCSLGIPALSSATLGTGSSFTPGSQSCDIYSINLLTGFLQQIQGVSKTVYNLSATAVPNGWVVIQRDKFGNWLVGLGASATSVSGNGGYLGCNCFNCITPVQATVTSCSACPNNAAFQYSINFGIWTTYSQLGGTQILTYVSGCIWQSGLTFVPGTNFGTGSPDLGTGSPGGGGYYQWVLTMAGANTTLVLTFVRGHNIVGA